MLSLGGYGTSRRHFLRVGSLGGCGFALPQLLQARTAAAEQHTASASTFGRARHCILLFMWADRRIRIHLTQSPMRPRLREENSEQFLPLSPAHLSPTICRYWPGKHTNTQSCAR